MARRFIGFLAFSILTVGTAVAQTLECDRAGLIKWATEHGFERQTSDGKGSDAKELYCRQVVVVGSRLAHTQCGTEADLVNYVFNDEDSGVPYWTCPDFPQ